jgi:hypothetical protein
VVSGREVGDGVLAAQDAALARLAARDFPAALTGFVDGIARSPRAPQARVTFDFWDQLRSYERLEELRMYRPGIYKALG